MIPKGSPLGKKSSYISTYNRDLLFPIPRYKKREEINIPKILPFTGYDIWNSYEISWLNDKGKPVVGIAEFIIPCESPNIIESKSFKLYLNSLNNSKFLNSEQVKSILTKDISEAVQAKISVEIYTIGNNKINIASFLPGKNIDDLDVECIEYTPNPLLLTTGQIKVEETLNSNLLKSNCLVTSQPDWGSLMISYKGNKINQHDLLKYVISYRNHNEFHEQCVERIFMDILNYCQPEMLTVYARYTRRGGLDINPLRTNKFNNKEILNLRLIRQ